jgi:hypothetical protein
VPLNGLDLATAAIAAPAAGFVNAPDGGGTLLSFPILMAVGVRAAAGLPQGDRHRRLRGLRVGMQPRD